LVTGFAVSTVWKDTSSTSSVPLLKLAIEVDGDSHFQKGSQHKDRSRQTFLESFRIHFFRIRNVEVFEHLDDIVLAIGRRIQNLERTKFTPL
jgi:very-short-patch-repair endonuclease